MNSTLFVIGSSLLLCGVAIQIICGFPVWPLLGLVVGVLLAAVFSWLGGG